MAVSNYYTDEEKAMMLRLAREAIENRLQDKPFPDTSNLPDKLFEIRSCFVTLHTKRDAKLRGCIGSIQAYEPLVDNIIHNAENAAFNDPRFTPLSSLEELNSIVIEISVLTPPVEIPSISDFVIGKHGIIIRKDGRSAVFLPQVAPEQRWDVNTTMMHLCIKAGLYPEAWKEKDAGFFVFEAIVFSE